MNCAPSFKTGLLLLLFLAACSARAEFTVPELSGPVVDSASMIPRDDERQLTQILRSLRSRGGTQVTIVTLPELAGLTIEQASIKIAEHWKLGDAKKDDGVLIVLAQSERKIRIEVGQGLEGVLPDVRAKRIIADHMVPLLKTGQIGTALTIGIYQIMQSTNPEIQMDDLFAEVSHPGRYPRPIHFGFLIFFFLIFLLSMRNAFLHRRGFGSVGSPWGASSWGGGSGWSGGGGGWSGGGGGFSGGGASGDW